MSEIVNQLKSKSAGFTLVEVLVVLGIISVVAAGSVTVFSEHRDHSLWQESELKLKTTKKALVRFARANKYMPCPDTDVPPDGVENRNVNGTCAANAAGVPSGTIPYEDLNMSLAMVSDAWLNPFIYAVNHKTTNVVAMNNCPESSACFFNNTQPPMFNLTTLPMPSETVNNNMNGDLTGAGLANLRICNNLPCGLGAPAQSIDAESAIAVILSQNKNGDTAAVGALAPAEALNAGNGNFFVQAPYSENPYFDDQLVSISANELKERFQVEAIQNTNPPAPPSSDPDNPFGNLNVPIAGGSGDNNRFSSNIGLNIVSGVIEFGSEYAGQTVTFSFDAKVTGGWEDADALNEGVAAETYRGNIETQDQFVVGLNADVDERLYNIANGGNEGWGSGLVDLEQGLDWFGVDQAENSEQYNYYDENDDRDNTWYEHKSYDVVLDENGNLKVDFAVFSTHVSEKVDVNNIEAELFIASTNVPPMPSVQFTPTGENDSNVQNAIAMLEAMKNGDTYNFVNSGGNTYQGGGGVISVPNDQEI